MEDGSCSRAIVSREFTRRLTGDQYGFESLSFVTTETHPGGGPGLHLHDTEEAHVLLVGTVQYRVSDKTFTVHAPHVANVPSGGVVTEHGVRY